MGGMLEGKAALITGGANGIGRAAALLFAREGARVAAADLNREGAEETAAMVREAGGEAVALAVEVSDAGQVEAMLDAAAAAFGRIDCAFNNAGIAPGHVGNFGNRTHQWSEEGFDRMIAVNLKGVWLCMRGEIERMAADGGGGAIVNTSSIAGLLGLPGIHYFGSHGRERLRPGRDSVEANGRGRDSIRSVCERLARTLGDVDGFRIEDKFVSAAAHYRNTRPADGARVERAVHGAVGADPSLNVAKGKMVFDITPADGVDKGTAVTALRAECGGLALYFGDDTTDEAAFGALPPPAVTVYVGPASRPTLARYRLADPPEVSEALHRILAASRD